eukprot:5211050-Amphidinium_carterae.1
MERVPNSSSKLDMTRNFASSFGCGFGTVSAGFYTLKALLQEKENFPLSREAECAIQCKVASKLCTSMSELRILLDTDILCSDKLLHEKFHV